jgi:ABC-type transport system involved in multi-copper enzyme maturation permease subunit
VSATLRLRQTLAIVGLELRKTFLRKRALGGLLVAFAPALLLGARALQLGGLDGNHDDMMSAAHVADRYAIIFQTLYLRLIVFFGCVAVFVYSFRGEILERSLHFYLMAPMPRAVLLAGKYLAAVLVTSVVFCLSTLTQLVFAFWPSVTANGMDYLLHGPGRAHALAYLAINVLACVGYGAVFLTLGLLARNPMIPIAAVLGWETINVFLPPVLQKISVFHHLQTLCPVPISQGPFSLHSDPSPAWAAVLGLLLLAAALLWISARRVRRIEVLYAGD